MKDEFGLENCIKDRLSFTKESVTYQINHAIAVDGSIYLLANDASNTATLFYRYNARTFSADWVYREEAYLEILAVTPDELSLFGAVDGQGNNQSISLFVYQTTSARLSLSRIITGYSAYFPTSNHQMEVISNSNIYIFANSVNTQIDLINININDGSMNIIEMPNTFTFSQLLYSSTSNSLLIMYHLTASKDLRFGGINLNGNSVFQSAGITCVNELDISCTEDVNPAKAINDDQTIGYFLTTFQPLGMFFISLNFNSADIIHGQTFIPSVSVQRGHHLHYYGGYVYLIFETTDSKFVFAKYEASSDTFTDEIYETSVQYRKSFFIITTIFSGGFGEEGGASSSMSILFHVGNKGDETIFCSCYYDFEKSSITLSVPSYTAKIMTVQGDTLSVTGTRTNTFTPVTTGKIKKGANTTVNICLPYSMTWASTLSYTFSQNKEDEDQVSYILSYDDGTSKLRVVSQEDTLESTTSNFTVTASSSYGKTYNTEVTIEKSLDSGDQVAISGLQGGIMAVGAVSSIFGAIIGGSLIQALWMIFNQQKMLLFFILMDTYIDALVKFILLKQNFGLFHFDFLSVVTPSFITTPVLTKEMDTEQKTEPLEEIGFEYESFLRTYWTPILMILLSAGIHISSRIIFKNFPSLSQANSDEAKRENSKIEPGVGNDESPSDRDKNMNDIAEIQEPIDEEEPHNQSEHQVDKSRDQLLMDQVENGNLENSRPKGLNKADNYQKKASDDTDFSKNKVIGEEVKNDPIEDPPRSKGQSLKDWLKKSLKKLLLKTLKNLESDNYWNVYFRFMIESFMGGVLVTLNEMKTNNASNRWEKLSLAISYIFFTIFLAFYVFVLVVCYKEFKRRKGYELIPQSDNEEIGLPDVEDEIYGEIFADLDKKLLLYSTSLNLTRILIMVFFVMVVNMYDESTVWIIFILMLVLQTGYTIQAYKILKFKWWPLKVIYLINEVFLCLFVAVFGFLKTYQDWKNSASKVLVLLMIFCNTMSVIFFQTCGNYIQSKLVCGSLKNRLFKKISTKGMVLTQGTNSSSEIKQPNSHKKLKIILRIQCKKSLNLHNPEMRMKRAKRRRIAFMKICKKEMIHILIQITTREMPNKKLQRKNLQHKTSTWSQIRPLISLISTTQSTLLKMPLILICLHWPHLLFLRLN
ncbi:unnamed protein product [Moneuplotes crassus]|uniref:Uncharacterized protein n=1 Tax=Euplotes crassus TaxID=5936 RepID=A0AAD2DA37_EUPCR|nr:unnamed protein product [Moneuplotes crassus]